MRIFYAFLVIVTTVILFLLPISEGVYDFQTDLREDDFTVNTAVGATTANVTLLKPIYDNDTSTIGIISDTSDDVPLYSSYNTTTRLLAMSGLSGNTTRTITVSYDIDALEGSDAINAFIGYIEWIWILILVAFPAAALVAIFIRRRD